MTGEELVKAWWMAQGPGKPLLDHLPKEGVEELWEGDEKGPGIKWMYQSLIDAIDVELDRDYP